MAGQSPLSADLQREAFRRIAAWQTAPDQPVTCPACGKTGFTIEDRSARPHAEWYAIACAACGLEAVLHRPLAHPIASLD